MANDIDKNVSKMVLKKFLPGFMSDLVLAETIERQLLVGVINPNTGDSVQLKRPHQYRSERTPGGDMTGKSASEIISATATARISDFITVFIDWTILEQAIELNQLEEILQPAREEMVTTLENELARFMINNAGLTSGFPNEPIDAWGDVAGTGSYLKALGVTGEMYATMNPFSVQDLADTQSGLASGNNNLVDSAWERSQISRNFGGLKAFMSNSLESYTTGTITGSGAVNGTPIATYPALKDSYQMTINLDGFAAGATIKAGQQIMFPATLMLNQQNKTPISKRNEGIPFIGTILADAEADGAGAITVFISGAAIVDASLPQYNTVDAPITDGDVVTVLGVPETVYQPGLAYTKGFVGMGFVEIPPLNGWDSSVVNHKGFSIRATKFSDPITNVQSLRLDMVPVFCVYQPMMGMQFFGNV